VRLDSRLRLSHAAQAVRLSCRRQQFVPAKCGDEIRASLSRGHDVRLGGPDPLPLSREHCCADSEAPAPRGKRAPSDDPFRPSRGAQRASASATSGSPGSAPVIAAAAIGCARVRAPRLRRRRRRRWARPHRYGARLAGRGTSPAIGRKPSLMGQRSRKRCCKSSRAAAGLARSAGDGEDQASNDCGGGRDLPARPVARDARIRPETESARFVEWLH